MTITSKLNAFWDVPESVFKNWFGGFSAADCLHIPIVVGGRKLDELPEFRWMNTVLSNVKISLSGACHAFDFSKYAGHYCRAYRFNRRFKLKTSPKRPLVAAVATHCSTT